MRPPRCGRNQRRNAVAWAIERRRRPASESLDYGSPDDARALLEEIVARESTLGDALADGVDAASARLGGDDLLPTVRPWNCPRTTPAAHGAWHWRTRPATAGPVIGGRSPSSGRGSTERGPERAAAAVICELDQRSVLWCLVVDDFVGDAFDDLGAEWLDAVGLDTDGDLATVGERVWTLTRLFNVREGISRADDALPAQLRNRSTRARTRARQSTPNPSTRCSTSTTATGLGRRWPPHSRDNRTTRPRGRRRPVDTTSGHSTRRMTDEIVLENSTYRTTKRRRTRGDWF